MNKLNDTTVYFGRHGIAKCGACSHPGDRSTGRTTNGKRFRAAPRSIPCETCKKTQVELRKVGS